MPFFSGGPASEPALPIVTAGVIASGGFCLAAALARCLAIWLPRAGMIDPPAAGFQQRAIPRGGGLAIVLPVLLCGGGLLFAAAAAPAGFAVALLATAGVAAVSFADDVSDLPVWMRLAAHVSLACVATAALGPVRQLPAGPFGTVALGFAAWPISVLWIVGLTNAFNFMDGVDGMAGTTAAVAGAAIALASWLCGQPATAGLALALAAAAAGFLTANWPPARIFMGDVGSTFCGFLIATLPLMASAGGEPRILTIAALAAWPFILDTSWTLAGRLARGENVLQPHRRHLYQRLVLAGRPHGMVSCLYGAVAAVSAAAGILILTW